MPKKKFENDKWLNIQAEMLRTLSQIKYNFDSKCFESLAVKDLKCMFYTKFSTENYVISPSNH